MIPMNANSNPFHCKAANKRLNSVQRLILKLLRDTNENEIKIGSSYHNFFRKDMKKCDIYYIAPLDFPILIAFSKDETKKQHTLA